MALPEPNFIARDGAAITAEIIAQYESLAGKTLYPAQVERVFIDVMAYRETLLRIAIQETAKQNLLAYARAPVLDYLGELMGVSRLPASAARVAVQFTLADVAGSDIVIPADTPISAGAGRADSQFVTDAAITIPAGEDAGAGMATAIQAGIAGNGWVSGQLTMIGADLGVAGLTVTNTATSAGGTDEENDAAYRQRLHLAPESYTTAGSIGAYRFHALSAHPSIIDVAITSSVPGQVDIYPLTADGLPSGDILTRVAAACNAEEVRPLCDLVMVAAPTVVEYSIQAQLTVYADADGGAVLTAAQAALTAFTTAQAQRLGRDIIRNQIIGVLMAVPGVYTVALPQPPQSRPLAAQEWARCTARQVVIVGVAEDVL